jgi:hypothetical protein
MAIIAPDTGSQFNDVAPAPSYVPIDLAAGVSTPTTQLAQGQALNGLAQLSDQLALEKAQRQADMASTNYKIAATGYLTDNLPTLAASDRAALLASIAGSRSTAAGATNELTKATAYANAGGPGAAGAAAAQTNSNQLAGAVADFNSGYALAPTFQKSAIDASAAAAGTGLGNYLQILTPPAAAGSTIQAGSAPLATAPAAISAPPIQGGYTPGSSVAPGTGALAKAALAVPQGAAAPPSAQVPAATTGGLSTESLNPAVTSMMQGIRNAAFIDNTTDAHTLEIPNYPNAGETSTVFQRISKADGSVVSQSAPIVTKNDATRLVQRSAQDIVNLQTSNNLIGGVQTALDAWKKTYPSSGGFNDYFKSIGQAGAAVAANSPTTGPVSLIEKSIGGMAESDKTRDLVGAIQVYNQSLIKLDPDTQKGASAIGLSVGDIVAPEQLQKKLDGAKDYAAARLNTFAKDNISERLNPGTPDVTKTASSVTAPAVTPPAAQPENAPVVYKGVKGTIQTLNGQQYFVPSP